MAWTKIKMKRQHNFPAISFRNSGLYFNSIFMEQNRLEDCTAIDFHRDDENPFKLGFTFHLKETSTSLSLVSAGRDKGSKGRTVKASALRAANKIIDAECKIGGDPFEIQYDKFAKIYFVELRPNFNIKIKLEAATRLPNHIKGIYRYLNSDKQIIYIGKGVVKDRILQNERSDWGIEVVEYSVIEDEALAFEWESYYINEHIETFGSRPIHNKISGKS